MEFRPPDTIQVGKVGKNRYVMLEDAAQFLGVSDHRLSVLIKLDRIATVQVESHKMIEVEILMDFDISKYPVRRGR